MQPPALGLCYVDICFPQSIDGLRTWYASQILPNATIELLAPGEWETLPEVRYFGVYCEYCGEDGGVPVDIDGEIRCSKCIADEKRRQSELDAEDARSHPQLLHLLGMTEEEFLR